MLKLIIVNLVAWLIIHFGMSFLCFKLPNRFYAKDLAFFRMQKWEKEGQLWDKLFGVKKWKKHLMDGSKIVKASYDKSRLHGTKLETLSRFHLETKRAELTHWLILLPVPLFFLWNPMWAAWINVFYAVIANVPFIVTQRYNRGRVERVLLKQKKASP